MPRLGQQYRKALPIWEQGTGKLHDTLSRVFEQRQRAEDEERANAILSKQYSPKVGEIPAEIGPSETESRSDTGLMLQKMNVGLPQMGPMQTKPLEMMDPADITELLLQRSGEGTRQVQARVTARDILKPKVDKDRYLKVSKGQRILDLVGNKEVYANPSDAKVKEQRFSLDQYPLDVQQYYKVATDPTLDTAARKRNAMMFEVYTGMKVDVVEKSLSERNKDRRPNIRSVNGGVYQILDEIDPETGELGYKEIIPPGLSPEAQLSVLETLNKKRLIDDKAYEAAVKEIGLKYRVTGMDGGAGGDVSRGKQYNFDPTQGGKSIYTGPSAGAEEEDMPLPDPGESKEDYIERLTGLGYTIGD